MGWVEEEDGPEKPHWGAAFPIRLLLSLGKKVYLRSEVYTFSFFRDIGIQLFDTIRLLDDADEGFLELDPEVARENARVVREFFSPKKCVENWQTVFDA
ncbi:MAG TPA: hypothetical protein P5560_13705 [Thermotogota bacterium]|nr:hypothetical protein [Thermotogota bacterium]